MPRTCLPPPPPPPLPWPPQVHLRLQWQTDAVRGQSTKVEVDLAGLSLVVMGGLQVGRARRGRHRRGRCVVQGCMKPRDAHAPPL